ncbi:MAG: DUF4105 domain-containing protein [Terracidiphilus sp.]
MKNSPDLDRREASPVWLRVLRRVGTTGLWLILAVLTLWALAALYIDTRIAAWRIPLTLIYGIGIFVILFRFKWSAKAAALCLAAFCIVLVWWFSLKPSNDENWQPDVARTAWVGFDGDRITIHNLRNCSYRSEFVYENCWSDRTLDLSQIKGADLFLTNWGLSFASHPIVSFQFGDKQHVAFSIEARYKTGQSYSTILGCFRQFGLIFVASDERDVIRLRTNYRKDEEVYMYRIQVRPEVARAMFLTYVTYLNKLNDHPEWYNELTRNCTTTIQKPLAANTDNPQPWTYQYILNGKLDELLYDRGRLVTGGLPFSALKSREHINAAARAAGDSPDFSALIRAGRIGF